MALWCAGMRTIPISGLQNDHTSNVSAFRCFLPILVDDEAGMIEFLKLDLLIR